MPNSNQPTTSPKETKLSKSELLEAVMEIADEISNEKVKISQITQEQSVFILRELKTLLTIRLEI